MFRNIPPIPLSVGLLERGMMMMCEAFSFKCGGAAVFVFFCVCDSVGACTHCLWLPRSRVARTGRCRVPCRRHSPRIHRPGRRVVEECKVAVRRASTWLCSAASSFVFVPPSHRCAQRCGFHRKYFFVGKRSQSLLGRFLQQFCQHAVLQSTRVIRYSSTPSSRSVRVGMQAPPGCKPTRWRQHFVA